MPGVAPCLEAHAWQCRENSIARESEPEQEAACRSWPEILPPVDSGQRGPESCGGKGKEAAQGNVISCLMAF